MLARVFEEAGLPPGVFSVLPGRRRRGRSPRRSTRSSASSPSPVRPPRVASVGALGAQHLKRVHLELGGNSALIVMDDVDLEKAVSVGAFGSFMHQGQICMTTGRHLVDAAIADDYAALLAEHADHLPVGDPKTGQVALGPLIDAQAARPRPLHGRPTRVDAGATLLAGGTYEELFYRPTVLTNVPTTSPAYCEEVFGPVAPGRLVLAHSTRRSRSPRPAPTDCHWASCPRTDCARSSWPVASPRGAIHINDQTVADEAVIPFGGTGSSGNGSRMGGLANLDAYTETQWVTAQSELPATPSRGC